MASRSRLQFTDEEIWDELRKLGYNNLSPQLFQFLKEDLLQLVEAEENQRSESSAESSIFSETELQPHATDASPILDNDKQMLTNKLPGVPFEMQNPVATIKNSQDTRKLDSDSNKENQSFCSTTSSLNGKTIKRKTLRHKNGKAIISEKFTSVSQDSDVFSESSYSSLESSSSSTRDSISLRSSTNGSGSMESIKQSGRVSPQSSIISHSTNVRRKKCDPVTRYHQYRKYWEAFKPPGEKQHNQLRWTVREKMLDYDFR